MAGAGLQGVGLRALLTFQRALQTTAHNIANATTPGYTRQETLFQPAPGQRFGAGYIGGGVRIEAVRRNFNELLVSQRDLSSSSYAQQRTLAELSANLDALIGPNGVGLDQGFNDFFASLETLATDPTSPAIRSGVLSQAGALADRFRVLDGQIDEVRTNVNGRIAGTASEITSLAQSIARLNDEIARAGSGATPNDLLDQRDGLLTQLSELVDVETYEGDDGSVNVTIASGQSLILGNQASSLVPIESPYDKRELGVGIQPAFGGEPLDITRSVAGGTLGGALQFRAAVLDPIQSQLGQIAAVFVDRFNAQHQLGEDSQGNPGGDFFTPLLPEVQGNINNVGPAVTVAFEDPAALTGSDYQLDFDGATWTLTDLTTRQTVPLTPDGGDLVADGLRITPSVGATAGDSFQIRPTRAVAGSLSVALSDASEIAAAELGAGAGAVGDSTNALALAELQELGALGPSGLTFSGAYQQLVTATATEASQFAASAEIQGAVLADIQRRIDEQSGVNLDEEALNLQRFQQAYQAAAEVVSVADSLFETLLSATRR